MKKMLRYGIVALLSAACLSAAPRLSLDTAALGPFSIVAGTNGPPQAVGARNVGDGTLAPTVTSSAGWLSGIYQTTHTGCTGSGCEQIAVTLATSALAKGTYTGILTVTDPNALDVPQTITVTVNIGGTVPDSLTLYAPPGGSATSSFTTGDQIKSNINGSWLSVACNGSGSFLFGAPCSIRANATGLVANTYSGNVTFTNSTFAPDNKSIPVTFNVTASPIVEPGNTSIRFTASTPLGPNSKQGPANVWLGNIGEGTLVVGSTTVTVDTGAWLSVPYVVAEPDGVLVGIAADPTGLAVGPHLGTVTVNSNADNQPTVYNVELDVVDVGPGPTIAWPRILNIGNFTPGEAICPGDIVAVYGTDLLEGDPMNITAAPPLPTDVGTAPDDVQVLVNGTPAPIFYASYSQINIQIPFEISLALGPDGTIPDAQIQVVRGGVRSPIGTVPVAARAPRILQFGCLFNTCPAPYQTYGIGVNTGASNASVSFPLPTASETFPIYNPTYPSHPATAGDVIVFYAVGLGQTVPPLVTGAAAPSDPLPKTNPTYRVCFASAPLQTPACTTAQYSGATPTYVGLYQINVQIPVNAPRGAGIYMTVDAGGPGKSDPVLLAIQ
jgi:uncharacterized protein (TIGR03437 family)